MPKIDDYFSAANYIAPRLKQELRDFYDEAMCGELGLELQSSMSEWLVEASKVSGFDITAHFQNYIWFILSTENEVSSKAPLRSFTESRRKRRSYFLDCIKKEKKNGFKTGLLRDNCDTYFVISSSNRDDVKKYSSKEEYINSKYNQIIAWGSSKTNDLVTFPFIYQIPAWRAAKCFYNDCAVNIYSLIEDNFDGDVLHGYVKTIYKDINGPVWNLNPKEADVEFDVRSNEINSVLQKTVTSSDGMTDSIKTTVSSYKGKGDEFLEYVNSGNEQALVSSLLEQGVLSQRANVLDSTDKVLFGSIYSAFSVEDINKGSKSFNMMSLVKQMYGSTKPKRENYVKIVDHLDRMQHSHIDIVTTNAQGKYVKGTTINFFNVTFQVPQDDSTEDDTLYTSYSINTSTAHDLLIDAINECKDLSGISVDITPSKYFTDLLRENMNYHILTEIYNADMPIRVKSMLMLLAKERSDIYPRTSCTFPYDFFTVGLGIEPMRKDKLAKQLDNMLRYLKDHEYIVEDYKITAYSVEIHYIPVNDEEKRFYNLQPQNLIEEA